MPRVIAEIPVEKFPDYYDFYTRPEFSFFKKSENTVVVQATVMRILGEGHLFEVKFGQLERVVPAEDIKKFIIQVD